MNPAKTIGTEWRCQECNTLLGVERTPRLILRHKQVLYVVGGADYTVTAVCRNCSAVNERRSGKIPVSTTKPQQ